MHAVAAPRVRLRAACFAPFVVILLASASTSAAHLPRGVGVRLDYERGSGARQCPEATAFRDEVAANVGSDRFTVTGPWLLRVAIIRRKSGAFVVTANLFDGDGARSEEMGEMVSPSCRVALKDAALWTSSQLTDPPPAPAPVAPPTPPQRALPPPPPALRLRLGAATGIEVGVGPTPTPRFALQLGLQPTAVPWLSVAVELRSDLPLPATAPGGERIHALVVTGSLLACLHFVRGVLSWCPMYTAGIISSGEHLATTNAAGMYSAVGARFGVAIPVASGQYAFTFAGDVLGTLQPFRLELEGLPIWHTPAFNGALQIGFSGFI